MRWNRLLWLKLEVMKVNRKSVYSANGICDFCGIQEAKYSINGNLWMLCRLCMEKHYLSTYESLHGEGEEE